MNKLDVVSIRLVKDAPILSEKAICNPQDAIELLGKHLADMDREVLCMDYVIDNVTVALFLAAALIVAVYAVLLYLSGRTYNHIEDNTAIFISILSNHAKGSSDIVTIMNRTLPSLHGPLRGLVQKFVMDAENTGNVDIAFDFMKESVENRQLQTIIINLKNCMHLIQLGNDLDSGRSLDECLQELEMSFSNGEISSFCTVIKSLQSTGQVDEALRTLENNIEREQNSVNKRRCVVLEQKTTLYVILIAMDILGMLLYCIIMKLMEMQIGM